MIDRDFQSLENAWLSQPRPDTVFQMEEELDKLKRLARNAEERLEELEEQRLEIEEEKKYAEKILQAYQEEIDELQVQIYEKSEGVSRYDSF